MDPQTTDRKREEDFIGLDQAYLIASQPKTAEEWFRKGDALDDIEKREEAIVCFDKCIALKPDHAQAHYVKGFSLFVLGRKQEAMQAYDNAIKYDPKFVIAYCNRGKGFVGLDKEKEALADFTKAQELSKAGLKADTTLTQSNIAFIQSTLGSVVELQKISQEAEAAVKEHGQSHPLVLKFIVKSKLIQEDKKKNINKALELLNRQDDFEARTNKAALQKNTEDLKKAFGEMQQEFGKAKSLTNQVEQAQQDAKKQMEEAQKKLEGLKDANKLKETEGIGNKLEDAQSQLKKVEELKDINKLKEVGGVGNKLEENKQELNKNVDDMKKKVEDIKGVNAPNGRACCNMF